MTKLKRASNLFYCLITSPLWILQGLIFKKVALRLPEAKGLDSAENIDNEKQFDFLMLGDSVAAGVGIDHIDNALAGTIAKTWKSNKHSSEQQIAWQVIGQSGLKIGDLVRLLEKRTLKANYFVISIGVNDAKGFTSIKEWRKQTTQLFNLLLEKSPNAKIIILAVPDMNQFPLLHLPLAKVLGDRCEQLNQVTQALITVHPNLIYQPIEMTVNKENFAPDGFHPSSSACQQLAKNILTHVL